MIKHAAIFNLFLFVAAYFVINHFSDIKGNTQSPQEENYQFDFKVTDVTEKSGLSHTSGSFVVGELLANIAPWYSQVGNGVSVHDINNDGYMDFFFCNSKNAERNYLYINNKNGTFTDETEKRGLAFNNTNQGVCLRPIFFDYNNDHLLDLFISTSYCPLLYEQKKDGSFIDVTSKSGLSESCFLSYGSNILDYDKDGDLDILLPGYMKKVNLHQPEHTFVMPNTPFGADNGGPTHFFRNNGDGTFTEVYNETGLRLNGWTIATAVYDLNYDGYPDLWFAIDFNESKVFLNDQKGGFKELVKPFGEIFSHSGMGVDIEDLNANKKPAVYVTQIFFPGQKISGNQYFEFTDQEIMKNLAPEKRINTCGWSWGVKFIDLDNDSDEDLLVANGYISDNPKHDYWYNLMEIMNSNSKYVRDSKNWAHFRDSSLGGYQKNCLFLNEENNFLNISDQSPFGTIVKDARAIAKVDFDNNGTVDILVTNQDDQPTLYRNDILKKNRWIGFIFKNKSKTLKKPGITVEITLANGKVLTKQSYSTNGFFAQSDPRIHFGLGQHKIDKILITYSDNSSREFDNFRYNNYYTIIYED